MSEQRALDSEALVCPHCSTVNQPNTVICTGCGVRIDQYQKVKEGWLLRQAEARQAHQAQITDAAMQQVQAASAQSRIDFKRWLKWLLVSGIGAATLIIGLFLLVNFLNQLRTRALVEAYDKAVVCQEAQKYACARQGFLEVLRIDSGYRDARSRLAEVRSLVAEDYLANGNTPLALNEYEEALALQPGDPDLIRALEATRLQLAGEYERLGQWSRAIDLLEQVLHDRPGDQDLLARILNDYDQWTDQMNSQGRWLQARKIANQKKDRYPGK